MNAYEKLLDESDVIVYDNAELPGNIEGIYAQAGEHDVILLNKCLTNDIERRCILAEELGHYKTTYGDITDQGDIMNKKKEKLARRWGYEKLIGIVDLINAYEHGVRNRYELAEYLEVTETFLDGVINNLKLRYGLYYAIDNYVVYFEPLAVLKMI